MNKEIKLSDIITEIAFLGLPENCKTPTLEALSFCIALASSAWNQSNGFPNNHKQIIEIIKELENEDPDFWDDMRSKDWKEIHNRMMSYKITKFKTDKRKIHKFGYLDGKVRVEWL